MMYTLYRTVIHIVEILWGNITCLEFNIANENIKFLLDSKTYKMLKRNKITCNHYEKLIFTSHINNVCETP